MRLPDGAAFRADESLAHEFFAFSEDKRLPESLRDFCIDLSLRAKAIETGALGIAPVEALLRELDERANALSDPGHRRK
jgi:hypothetical protein